MEDWKEYKIAELVSMKNGKKRPMTKGKYPVFGGNGILDYADNYNAENTIIVGRVGAYCGNVYRCKGKCWVSDNAISVSAKEKVDNNYLFYLMSTLDLHHQHIGGAQPLMTQDIIGDFSCRIPSISSQQQIVKFLSSLDDKIELNRRINGNLEQQAQALFNHYFIERPDLLGKYKIGNLTEIANYLNGLAMQKFRPQMKENGIPVLKIKELGQGYTDASSDICSENIADEYKVHNGDVIFSWSGTLMVKIWCGGLCGLNQHLFKVTSEIYPKWFYYFWTKHHLNKFIRIAQDKAVTMGHIKRSDLEASEILIPQMDILAKLDAIINPLFSQIIEMKCENRNLATIRDILLPRLMSGTLKIDDLNR